MYSANKGPYYPYYSRPLSTDAPVYRLVNGFHTNTEGFRFHNKAIRKTWIKYGSGC